MRDPAIVSGFVAGSAPDGSAVGSWVRAIGLGNTRTSDDAVVSGIVAGGDTRTTESARPNATPIAIVAVPRHAEPPISDAEVFSLERRARRGRRDRRRAIPDLETLQ